MLVVRVALEAPEVRAAAHQLLIAHGTAAPYLLAMVGVSAGFRAAHQVNVEMQVGPLPETIATTVCTERTVKRLFSLSRQVILVFMVRFLLRHMFRHKP